MMNSGALTRAWTALFLFVALSPRLGSAQTPAEDDPGLKGAAPMAPAAAGAAKPAAGAAKPAATAERARPPVPAAPAPGPSTPAPPPSAPVATTTAAASTTPAGTPPPTPAAEPAPSNGVSYTVRLHDLERRVNELKEQIFRSKARLNLLKETVLHGVIAGSRAVFIHRNEMGSTYTLVKLVYALDGAEIFSKQDDTGHIGDNQEFEIFSGSIVPGNHTLSVVMVYQGNGYGVFSYLKGYKFTVRNAYTFTAAEGKQTQIKVVGFEKGNAITTDPKDRPAVDFKVNVIADNTNPAAAKK